MNSPGALHPALHHGGCAGPRQRLGYFLSPGSSQSLTRRLKTKNGSHILAISCQEANFKRMHTKEDKTARSWREAQNKHLESATLGAWQLTKLVGVHAPRPRAP